MGAPYGFRLSMSSHGQSLQRNSKVAFSPLPDLGTGNEMRKFLSETKGAIYSDLVERNRLSLI
jgi:hypothetical protein